jgi:tRNA-uridine aminocarboxypropyltransferase
MSREFCYVCHRAKVACLCGRIKKQANQIKIIVLQHPDEADHTKGSAIIAELGLQQYQCWKGENFKQHTLLNELISREANEMIVLYPAEQAQELTMTLLPKVKYLLIIDATWRKAKRIWECNPQLQRLRCAKLTTGLNSNYRIRKVPGQGYLSTVESIVEGLRVLEDCPKAYQPMLTLFDEMIDFQIASMGNEVYGRNYEG